jgi:FKBP-type peptidyl-prolyl cis-trans isomerase
MTLPAPRRGRTLLLLNIAIALSAAAPLAIAQQSATPPAPASGTAGKAPAKPAAAHTAASEKSSVSYSLGLSMGEQLRAGGVSATEVSGDRLAQGVHDGLGGKQMSDADRQNISNLLHTAYEGQGERNHQEAAKFLAANAKKPGVITTASGLQYKVMAAGSGESPKASDEVTVNYRGTLLDGTEFDSSYKRGQPATFQVSRVIPGWTEALQLMKPGAKYQLFIPPQLAYDMKSRPPIPPGSMLQFDVELLSVKAAQPAAEMPAKPAPSTGAASTPPPK